MERRPDLLKESNLTDKEKKWIRQVKRERKEAAKMQEVANAEAVNQVDDCE